MQKCLETFVHDCRSIYGTCSGNFLSVAFFLKIISFISKFSFFVSSAHICNSFKAHIGTKPCILLYTALAPVVQKLDSAIHMTRSSH